jgi:O-antigen/teichoic acid export membrane protein
MSTQNDNKRIAKNTLLLYVRQLLILFTSLYTIRIVLNVLGVNDYGIYNVVAGIVLTFSFLNQTMASATQRYFSFALGENDLEKLEKIFSVNFIIYIAIALFAFILLETVGLWFVSHLLKIPPDRLEAAQLIYHFSALTFVFTIFTAPFMAIIIAHEDMQIYAYVSIVEAALKLGMVFLLIYLPGDKLEIYGMLMLFVAVINAVVYIGICIRKYKECQFRRFYWDKELFLEIIGFTGWTFFGSLSGVVRNQAVTILLNQVFNPVVVAARAISMNISHRINMFSGNFNLGLYPPIIKSYAADDKARMFSLIFNGAKITFFLMWIFALPLFLEMDAILQMWLKTAPAGAVLFTRLAMVEVLINAISLPIATAARAPGKMRTYELTLGCMQISIFFIDWLVLTMGSAAYSVFIVAIVVNLIMFIFRLLLVRRLIGLPLRSFFRQVMFPVFLIILASGVPSVIAHLYLPPGLVFIGISVLLSMIFSFVSMYFIGLDERWRHKIKSMIVNKLAIFR